MADYILGETIRSHFDPSIVTASYFASLCGSLLTVEMLHRRGSGVYNLRSWFETVACAISMGCIGIWCMHFIGNRAIIMGNGEPNIQLVYDPGFTTLSVFLPIIGLTIAFSAAEYPTRSPALHWVGLTCTGTFAGLSIVGMHYIGNFGISNYRLHYVPRFFAASIIIAIGDCMLVLMLFYTWREKWISVWWNRVFCAMLLAGGVSAMHFTASTKCIYVLTSFIGPHAIESRNVQVIVASVMCGTAALITLCVLFFTQHRARVLKSRSHKIMLACAMFDPDGRVVVTTEGVLPAREITDKYNHRTFNEEFDTAHPVFQWIFRVTRNWGGVSELIPKMKSHLNGRKSEDEAESRPSSSASSTVFDPDTYSDYSVIFRERFCAAASSLASSMHLPIERMGVLYDKIIDTGTIQHEDKFAKHNSVSIDKSMRDVEMGIVFNLFGKGQLMFLTRRLNADDTDRLLNAGYRFANTQQVGRKIAETMQIPLPCLDVYLTDLKHYVDNQRDHKKHGTWLSCFVIVPKPNSKGFDVVVKRDEQDQLPDVPLLNSDPTSWQATFLQRLDNKSAHSCIGFLEDRQRRDSNRTIQERQFAEVILQAMSRLSSQLPASWFHNARFYGKPVFAHYSQPLRTRAPTTTLYSFVFCADLHTASIEAFPRIARIPLSFFSVRQQCYGGSPNHQVLARDIHQEFGPLLAARKDIPPTSSMSAGSKVVKKLSLHAGFKGKTAPRRIGSIDTSIHSAPTTAGADDTSSSSDKYDFKDKTSPSRIAERKGSYFYTGGETSTTVSPSRQVSAGAERHNNVYGGILVNSETVVKSDSKSEIGIDGRHTGMGLGMRVAVGTSKPEETFVDELFAVTKVSIVSRAG